MYRWITGAKPLAMCTSQSAKEADDTPAPSARLHADVPPLGVEPQIEIVVHQRGVSQQWQPRARRNSVPAVNSDTFGHPQADRRLAYGHLWPAGDVRMQPDRRFSSLHDRDWQSVEDLHAGSGGVPSVYSNRDRSDWKVPHGGTPSGSASNLPT